MAVITESITLQAAGRPLGQVEAVDLEASELDDPTPRPAASTAEASEILMLDQTPLALAARQGAYGEGVGGYQQ